MRDPDPVQAFADLLVLDWESVDRIRDANVFKALALGGAAHVRRAGSPEPE